MKKILNLMFLSVLFISCGTTQQVTRGEQYEKLYNESPTSILVMPPINNTNNVDAKDYFYTSLTRPLIEKGYYVFPPYLVLDLLQQESAYDSELFIDGDLSTFREVFMTDAGLFTVINTWQKQMERITAEIEYILKSAVTYEVLYKKRGYIEIRLDSSNNEGLAYLLSVITHASTPIITAARKCNAYVFRDLPLGPYSPAFLNDKDYFVDQEYIRVVENN